MICGCLGRARLLCIFDAPQHANGAKGTWNPCKGPGCGRTAGALALHNFNVTNSFNLNDSPFTKTNRVIICEQSSRFRASVLRDGQSHCLGKQYGGFGETLSSGGMAAFHFGSCPACRETQRRTTVWCRRKFRDDDAYHCMGIQSLLPHRASALRIKVVREADTDDQQLSRRSTRVDGRTGSQQQLPLSPCTSFLFSPIMKPISCCIS